MTAQLAAPSTVMPAPPNGMAWVLKLDPMYNSATLWLFKQKCLSRKPSGWSVICRSVSRPRGGVLRLSQVSNDELVEGVVATAHELIGEIAALPAKKAAVEARAQELSQRLGIKVEVKS